MAILIDLIGLDRAAEGFLDAFEVAVEGDVTGCLGSMCRCQPAALTSAIVWDTDRRLGEPMSSEFLTPPRSAMAVLILGLALIGCAQATPAPTSVGPTPTAPSTPAPTLEATQLPSTELSISADDGLASLVIPVGALPVGTDPGSISLVRSDPAEWPAESAALVAFRESGLATGPSYELVPAGLTFAEPARLRLATEADGTMLSAFLIDNGIEPLEVTTPDAADAIAIEFLVPHFSVVATSVSAYHLRLTYPDTVVVDEPFTTTLEIYREGRRPLDYLFSGTMIGGFPLEPGIVELGTGTVLSHDISVDVEFSCPEVTTAQIKTHGFISIERPIIEPILDRIRMFLNPDYGQIHDAGDLEVQLECVAASAVEQAAAGTYEGQLVVGTVPNAPGDSYRDKFVLELDECGGARLVQRGTQATTGNWIASYDGNEVELFVLTTGAGSDYAEEYRVTVTAELAAWLAEGAVGTIVVDGLLAGAGHGFGPPPDPDAISRALDAAQASPEGLAPGQVDDLVGWLGTISGELERTGEAPGCE